MSRAADDEGMVIVGAGECGARAAVTLREKGWQGRITLIGAEPHLPYERPPLSKSFMTEADQASCRPNADALRLAELEIEHLASRRVASIDPPKKHVVMEDGSFLRYRRLLLATGAEARRVGVPGGEKAICLRTIRDAERIRENLSAGKRIAILGGGLIGMELAASAATLGGKVTVIEQQSRILSRGAPPSLAAIIEARHRSAGVDFLLGTGVSSIGDSDGTLAVNVTSGPPVEVDMVVAGIGALPNVDLAVEAGLTVDNGIVTDEFLRSSDPAIFAAGDCASMIHPLFANRRLRLESWRNALEQGERAARNMLGESIPQETAPWFWSDQYELCLQVAGLTDMGATTVERNLGPGALFNLHLDEEGTLVAASAVGPLGLIGKDMRIAEMLIARRIRPDQTLLSEPSYRLKSLLAA